MLVVALALESLPVTKDTRDSLGASWTSLGLGMRRAEFGSRSAQLFTQVTPRSLSFRLPESKVRRWDSVLMTFSSMNF